MTTWILARQALHAHKLHMRHPITLQPIEFALPSDFLAAIKVARGRRIVK